MSKRRDKKTTQVEEPLRVMRAVSNKPKPVGYLALSDAAVLVYDEARKSVLEEHKAKAVKYKEELRAALLSYAKTLKKGRSVLGLLGEDANARLSEFFRGEDRKVIVFTKDDDQFSLDIPNGVFARFNRLRKKSEEADVIYWRMVRSGLSGRRQLIVDKLHKSPGTMDKLRKVVEEALRPTTRGKKG